MPSNYGSPGISFQPGADKEGQGQGGGPESPLQSAIQLLSLRLPSVVGARGIAPQGLLQGGGMAGAMGAGGMSPEIMAFLQRLMSGGMAQGGPSASPRVVPGTEGPTPGQGDIGQVDWAEILRGKTGGNTGIGNTGRPNGPLMPNGPVQQGGPMAPAPESDFKMF
jgi:hypothetical protein